MSDKDTSCYITHAAWGNIHGNTLHRHTLLFSFPCLPRNGIRRTVKGTGRKNRTSLRAQDFSETGLAEPLTVTECEVIFAIGKEKLILPFR